MFGHADRCRIIGLSTKMHELMAAADVLIGKPGGLTTAEAIARRLPMVLLRPIPGQEEHNARMLVDAGCAIRADDPMIAGRQAAALLASSDRLQTMRASAARLTRPGSARAAAAAALGLCERAVPPHRLLSHAVGVLNR